jgi:hypothetical protein
VTRRRRSPEAAQQIAGHARDHVECQDCGAAPGQPCIRPGSGRSTCKSRFVVAAIALRRELRDAGRTPEQEAILAGLPRIPREEIEACRTPNGGYRLTKEWFTSHGIPYPPPAGWRQAVEQEDDGDDR